MLLLRLVLVVLSRSVLLALLSGALGACGASAGSAPVPPVFVVEVPPPEALRPEALPPPVAVAPPAAGEGPQDVPRWQPPGGHGDPCATWISEKGLFDCNAENEFPPGALDGRHRVSSPPDAGGASKKAR
jgi:hypothetical protein